MNAQLLETKKPVKSSLNLKKLDVPGYEEVVHATDSKAGLSAIIAIHDRTLGPSLGGIRIQPYPTFEAALNDVLRLAKGMTYKSAVAEWLRRSRAGCARFIRASASSASKAWIRRRCWPQ